MKDYQVTIKTYEGPVNIYEVDLNSWRKYGEDNFFDYPRCAKDLIPYAKEMGYTHIQLMPTNGDLTYFLELAESMGLGVIRDWIPAERGFSFKWNKVWAENILDYIQGDSLYRENIHYKLTVSPCAFGQHFILPISHEEVGQGKKSLLDKFPGAYEEKFAGLRAFMGYMMAHPGKKHIFMGCEIGQFVEWDSGKAIEWFLLDFPAHKQTQDFFREINHFYLENPPLWQEDYSGAGFRWIIADDNSQNIIAFRRFDKNGEELLIMVNFSPVSRSNYKIGVPEEGQYRVIFHTDKPSFGGRGPEEGPTYEAYEGYMHELPYHISVELPGLSALYIKKEKAKRRVSLKERSDNGTEN